MKFVKIICAFGLFLCLIMALSPIISCKKHEDVTALQWKVIDFKGDTIICDQRPVYGRQGLPSVMFAVGGLQWFVSGNYIVFQESPFPKQTPSTKP